MKYIFDELVSESVVNYTKIFEALPLERLNPATLAPYLPPGRSEKMLKEPFWCKVRSLVDKETFEQLFIEDKARIYESIAVEYCYDLEMPGKSLVILQDALMSKMIHRCNDTTANLTLIALEAAERAIYNQKIRPLMKT